MEHDFVYLDLLERIRHCGVAKGDRTGTGTLSLFAPQLRFDFRHGFPLLTTKFVNFDVVVKELLWFIEGGREDGNMYSGDLDAKIWDHWADTDGNLGPVYGAQWRQWRGEPVIEFGGDISAHETIDQLSDAVHRLRNNPTDRRIIVSAWNVGDIAKMKLPPCHLLFQFVVTPQEVGPSLLNCHMYQRSADMFIGVPFNIASYALLTQMVAQCVGMVPGQLVISFGDAHIYANHLDQVDQQLNRHPFPAPQVHVNDSIVEIDHFKFDDIVLTDYRHHLPIKAPIAV